MTEKGRVVPSDGIIEEWETWEQVKVRVRKEETVPLPEKYRDSFFCPTPYGVAFSYPTLELGCRAEGAVVVFVDYDSLGELWSQE